VQAPDVFRILARIGRHDSHPGPVPPLPSFPPSALPLLSSRAPPLGGAGARSPNQTGAHAPSRGSDTRVADRSKLRVRFLPRNLGVPGGEWHSFFFVFFGIYFSPISRRGKKLRFQILFSLHHHQNKFSFFSPIFII